MALMTMASTSSPLNPTAPRPFVSSPLAANGVATRPRRNLSNASTPAFPTSRPLRPFPSIANTLPGSTQRRGAAAKPVKLIEPPANFKCAFVLNLTQAEFSRQD